MRHDPQHDDPDLETDIGACPDCEGRGCGDEGAGGAETKAYNLHRALSSLLGAYKQLVKDTNSEPLFGVHAIVVKTEKALFENRPMADWEAS